MTDKDSVEKAIFAEIELRCIIQFAAYKGRHGENVL